MQIEQKPLYALTIGEFIILTKQLIEQAIKEQETKNTSISQNEEGQAETFNIGELAKFLRCSKVSIHNYKKMGMPFYRIGRKILFKKTEILNFMKKLKYKGTITA